MNTTTAQTDTTVAQTILDQLGGLGRLRMMVGASQFAFDAKSVQFKLGGGAKSGINFVRITLDASDTYTVLFCRKGRIECKTVKELSFIYNDQLVDLFESTTGFYLTFCPRRAS